MRVNRQTHERLSALAAASGRNIPAIVGDAVAAYEADTFWDAFDAGWQRLSDDPTGLAQIRAEQAGQAPALTDGLDD